MAVVECSLRVTSRALGGGAREPRRPRTDAPPMSKGEGRPAVGRGPRKRADHEVPMLRIATVVGSVAVALAIAVGVADREIARHGSVSIVAER